MHPRPNRLPVLLTALLLCTTALGAEQPAAVSQLHSLFDREWAWDLKDDPRAATFRGGGQNDRWADHSLAAWAKREQHFAEVLQDLAKIDASQLPPDEKLNYELFRRLYGDRVELLRFNAHLRPLDQLNYSSGVLTANEVAGLISFDSIDDYRDWIARMRGMGAYIDQTIELLRAGIREKNVQPRIIVERVLEQLQGHLVEDPTASPFFLPFKRFPDAVSDAQQTELLREAKAAIDTVVVPAYQRLKKFLAILYLPASRSTVGIWDSPQGDAFYRSRVQWHTTTQLSPDEIHEIGVKEVARIRGEMDKIIGQVEFKGSFEEFLHYLRTDARFRYDNGEDLLQAYMVMAKRIDPLLPEYFGKLPRTPYGVRPIPAGNAPYTTTAYYQPLSADGRRAGYYYVNLYRPEQRPTYEIPVLTIHEAVPGHHLQFALAMEAGERPRFRGEFDATAFVEGWGLYAESLGNEMGLYADPYDKFGQLTYEMWRAVRLVVDTGMHAKHWTRERAIDYFKANAAKSELDIVNEVDRYIAWPGQATAYKIGELKIKELRNKAQQALGEKFDLRSFHDTVLASGPVPLDVLEGKMGKWIDRVMK